MGFFRWLYRLPGRIDRSMEKTALAASVVEGEGIGGTQFNPQSVDAALGMLGATRPGEEDTAEQEGR